MVAKQAPGSFTLQQVQEAAGKHVAWAEHDTEYGGAVAIKVLDPWGNPTEHAMVYVEGEDGIAYPSRPVSSRYKPMSTRRVVETVIGEVGADVQEQVITREGGRQRIQLVMAEGQDLGFTPHDRNTEWVQHGEDTSSEILFPQIIIDNAYDGTQSLTVAVGLFRLVCSNGMTVAVPGSPNAKVRAVHTEAQLSKAIVDLTRFDFRGLMEWAADMHAAKVDRPHLLHALRDLPKRHRNDAADAAEMADGSAWGALQHLSYLGSHEFSLYRSSELQPAIDRVAKLGAA